MPCPGTHSPCFVAGDDLIFPVKFTESDGETPKDLTGATAKMDLRIVVTDSDPVVKTMSGGIIAATLGQMEFTLTDVETAALLPRATESAKWDYSVKITYQDLSEQTILTGSLTLQQVTTE